MRSPGGGRHAAKPVSGQLQSGGNGRHQPYAHGDLPQAFHHGAGHSAAGLPAVPEDGAGQDPAAGRHERAQTGVEIGMPDPYHFSKQFKHVVGMSPTAYLKHVGPMEPDDRA